MPEHYGFNTSWAKYISADDKRRIEDVNNPDAVYLYTDEAGKPVFGVIRGDDQNGNKKFLEFQFIFPPRMGDVQLSKSESGGGDRHGVVFGQTRTLRRVPFLMHQLVKDNRQAQLYIVEGEKDTFTLRAFEFSATTPAGATNDNQHDFGAVLIDREVTLISDNDGAGRKRTLGLYEAVEKIQGPEARSIGVIDMGHAWPECPPGGDITDYVEWLAKEAGLHDEWKCIFAPVVPQDWMQRYEDFVRSKDKPMEAFGFTAPRVEAGSPLWNAVYPKLRSLLEDARPIRDWKIVHHNKLANIEAYGTKGKPGYLTDAYVVKDYDGSIMYFLPHEAPWGLKKDRLKETGEGKMKRLIVAGNGRIIKSVITEEWRNSSNKIEFDIARYNPTTTDDWEEVREGRLFKVKNHYRHQHIGPAIRGPRYELVIEAFEHLVRQNFPNGNDAEIMKSFMCHNMRPFGEKLHWAVMFQGTNGCGKGTIEKIIGHSLGPHMRRVSIDNFRSGSFNEILAKCRLACLNELSASSFKDKIDIGNGIKDYIDADKIEIRRKRVRVETDEAVYGNLYVGTNFEDSAEVIIDGANDKRWAFLQSALRSAEELAEALNLQWFMDRAPDVVALAEEEERKTNNNASSIAEDDTDARTPWFTVFRYLLNHCDGYESLRHYMENYSPKYGKGIAPRTTSRAVAVAVSRHPVAQELIERMELGQPPFAGDIIPSFLFSYVASGVITDKPVMGKALGTIARQIGKSFKASRDCEPNDFKGILTQEQLKFLPEGGGCTFYSSDPELDGRNKATLALERYLKAQEKALPEGKRTTDRNGNVIPIVDRY